MKKLTLIISMLILSFSTMAQISVSTYVDPKMAIFGAYDYDTTPSLNTLTTIKYSWEKVEVGTLIEYADINYFGMSVLGNFIAPLSKNLVGTVGIDLGFIKRWNGTKIEYTDTVGFNLSLTYYLNRHFGVSILGNNRLRRDFEPASGNGRGVKSGYMGVTYKF